jgi:hypothetical protein
MITLAKLSAKETVSFRKMAVLMDQILSTVFRFWLSHLCYRVFSQRFWPWAANANLSPKQETLLIHMGSVDFRVSGEDEVR